MDNAILFLAFAALLIATNWDKIRPIIAKHRQTQSENRRKIDAYDQVQQYFARCGWDLDQVLAQQASFDMQTHYESIPQDN